MRAQDTQACKEAPEPELLPCPFCGGDPVFVKTAYSNYPHRVQCIECGTVSPNGTAFKNHEWNAIQWNKRHTST